MSRIGERIKQARVKKNMTPKELAKLCGVSESYITEVESGRKVLGGPLIKKISGALGVNLDEPMYNDDDVMEVLEPARAKAPVLPKAAVKTREEKKEILPEWQSAFSNIIKDIPIYDIDLKEVLGHKHLPIIDRKVEGYNADKLIFITMPDNSMSNFRVKKGDRVMVILNPEVLNNGLNLVEYDGKRCIRHIKRLDTDKVLLLYSANELKTDTKSVKEIKILGHCIRAEIDLQG